MDKVNYSNSLYNNGEREMKVKANEVCVCVTNLT
jgi:hypothetical protein